MEKQFKCPFCIHSFSRQEAIPVDESMEVVKYKCPNPRLKPDNVDVLCGRILPLNFFEHDSHVISITGATYVGKTFYLLALLAEVLRNRELHKFGITGTLIGADGAVKDLRKQATDHRESRTAVRASLPGTELAGFALHVTINRRGRQRSIYLSLFDNPGDLLKDEDRLHSWMFNIYKADAMLFLVEPTQVHSLVDDVLGRQANPKGRKDADDLYEVLYKVTELLKYAQRNLRAEPQSPSDNTASQSRGGFWELFRSPILPADRVQIPVAIGISKADQIEHRLITDVPFDQADFGFKYLKGSALNTSMVDELSAELHDVLFDPDSGDTRLHGLLKSGYANYRLFALKTIDVDAEGKDKTLPEDVHIHQGVLLPFLWLLNRLNLL